MAKIQTLLEAASAFLQREADKAREARDVVAEWRWGVVATMLGDVQAALERIAVEVGREAFFRDVSVDQYDAESLLRAVFKNAPQAVATDPARAAQTLHEIAERAKASLTEREREILAQRFFGDEPCEPMACGCPQGAHPDCQGDASGAAERDPNGKIGPFTVKGIEKPVWVRNGDGSSLLAVTVVNEEGVAVAWFAQEGTAHLVADLLNAEHHGEALK